MNKINTEQTMLLNIGTIVTSIDEYAIAVWPGKNPGEFITKIGLYSGRLGEEYKYFATSNPYASRGKGLVVVIKRKPQQGERLQITKIFPRIAFADLI